MEDDTKKVFLSAPPNNSNHQLQPSNALNLNPTLIPPSRKSLLFSPFLFLKFELQQKLTG